MNENPMAANDPGERAAASETNGAADALEARLAAAEAEAADVKDKLLRALAETENVRRRATKERDDASKFAVSNFARDMVGVADNLRRALGAVDQSKVQDETVKALLAGVEATERELLGALERYGVKRIDPLGQPFDHNFHQAVFETADGNHAPGTVSQVLQAGYIIHDRLLRPAMVAVAKAGPAPAGGGRVDTVA